MKYCCFCGKETVFKTLLDGSMEKYCPQCDHVFFDTPSLAIIVAVIGDDEILLTRSVGSKRSYWGLIAGHVKSGETAEEATIREVREEVDLEISHLRILGTYYRKNYNLLMIGFAAKTKGVSIKTSKELEKAAWFSLYEPLPLHPDSIAAQIIKEVTSRIRFVK